MNAIWHKVNHSALYGKLTQSLTYTVHFPYTVNHLMRDKLGSRKFLIVDYMKMLTNFTFMFMDLHGIKNLPELNRLPSDRVHLTESLLKKKKKKIL